MGTLTLVLQMSRQYLEGIGSANLSVLGPREPWAVLQGKESCLLLKAITLLCQMHCPSNVTTLINDQLVTSLSPHTRMSLCILTAQC
jgi:hypothetical protein